MSVSTEFESQTPETSRSVIAAAAVSKLGASSGVSTEQAIDLAARLTAQIPLQDANSLDQDAWAVRIAALAQLVAQRNGDGPDISIGTIDPLTPDLTVITILNTNRPFLLDSLVNELQARAIPVRYVMHPILPVKRDVDGKLIGLSNTSVQESLIVLDIEQPHTISSGELRQRIESILQKVRVAVDDWPKMIARLDEAITHLETQDGETSEFLKWIRDGNFVLLGVRDFDLAMTGADFDISPKKGTGLGIMRDRELQVLRMSTNLVDTTPEITRFLGGPETVIVTKANVVSEVHRRAHMDYIGVKRFSNEGALLGELRIVGLFASSAYTQSVRKIPVLRRKVESVLQQFGHAPDTHSGKSVINTLENFPRDELFQINKDLLYRWVEGIEDLEVRPRLRVFARNDDFDRFVSVLAYIPRDRFSTQTRLSIEEALEKRYDGHVVATYPFFASAALVRIQFIIARFVGETPDASEQELESDIATLIETWEDRLSRELAKSTDPERAAVDPAKLSSAFETGYQQLFSPERALLDQSNLSTLSGEQPLTLDFFHENSSVSAALYHLGGPVSLSRRVPILENLGFSVSDERTFTIKSLAHPVTDIEQSIALHDMALEPSPEIDLETNESQLEDAFLAVWNDHAHNDSFNRLIGMTTAGWREAALLRTYAALLRQLQTSFDSETVAGTLLRYPRIAEHLLNLFTTRLNTETRDTLETRKVASASLETKIEAMLEDVVTLEDDRIIRMIRDLILATLRTNFFHPIESRSDADPQTIAIKLNSRELDFAPSPRPYREIFVFSPMLEAVHLRGGPIARGGIRWSDRQTDFRTEVLGLAKAQQVKNAVIVPNGAKGGFVPHRLPEGGSRDDVLAAGVAAYKTFVSALISITDNIKDGKIVPPEHTVRWDGDDPYLVVAADKGTATFSDIANEISQSHEFWLDDAFASGGSAGYDHKKMGITARGGWETVKRHFREMDRDIQSEPFTAIGVGDMSGDVFGNGMLLSRETRLLAAFDHRDIFIDPDPDTAISWEERKRLFDQGRSSWQDYDTAKMSQGGGIFPRSSKSIQLTPEIRKVLDIEVDRVTPNELMTAILKAPADLLWFGGIGTYIRAKEETATDVGDRANDAIRITASELQAKVVGEGANLGMTQRARVAFALNGGRVNTDAIDNSAGVNSSDLEVNIKIALGSAMQSGKLTREQRNTILESMTDDVAQACLRNNQAQSLTLSLVERNGVADTGYQQLLIRALEADGTLERPVEYLPTDVEIEERVRKGIGLTRPEIAVLIGYAKNHLIEQIENSELPKDPWFERDLRAYFPTCMQADFAPHIDEHQLRNEIIATAIANAAINFSGPSIIFRLVDETGAAPDTICKALEIARAAFALDELWVEIDALDNKISGNLQLDLFAEVQDALQGAARWLLNGADLRLPISEIVNRYKPAIDEVASKVDILTAKKHAFYGKAGVPDGILESLTTLSGARETLDIHRIAARDGLPIGDAAIALNKITNELDLPAALQAAKNVPVTGHHDRLALQQLEEMLRTSARKCARAIAKSGFEAWEGDRRRALDQARASVSELARSEQPTLPRLFLLAQQIATLADDI